MRVSHKVEIRFLWRIRGVGRVKIETQAFPPSALFPKNHFFLVWDIFFISRLRKCIGPEPEFKSLLLEGAGVHEVVIPNIDSLILIRVKVNSPVSGVGYQTIYVQGWKPGLVGAYVCTIT